jgi:hypothetical protein
MLSAAEIIKKTEREVETEKEIRKKRIEREIDTVTEILIRRIEPCFTAEHKWSVEQNGKTSQYYTNLNFHLKCPLNFDIDEVPRRAVRRFLKYLKENQDFSEYKFNVDYKWDHTPPLRCSSLQNGYIVTIKIVIKPNVIKAST